MDTVWEGVSVDTLVDRVDTAAEYVMAFSDGGYTTNLTLEDLTGGKARIVFNYDGDPWRTSTAGQPNSVVGAVKALCWCSSTTAGGTGLACGAEVGRDPRDRRSKRSLV